MALKVILSYFVSYMKSKLNIDVLYYSRTGHKQISVTKPLGFKMNFTTKFTVFL